MSFKAPRNIVNKASKPTEKVLLLSPKDLKGFEKKLECLAKLQMNKRAWKPEILDIIDQLARELYAMKELKNVEKNAETEEMLESKMAVIGVLENKIIQTVVVPVE